MKTKGANGVARFAVDFVVANLVDLELAAQGRLGADKVRRFVMSGTVDPGSTGLVLPKGIVEELGLRTDGKVKVTYADRRSATRDVAIGVHIELQGRSGTFNAVVEPKRASALIGAIVLEELDFLVDCRNQRLVPRDPRIRTSEME